MKDWNFLINLPMAGLVSFFVLAGHLGLISLFGSLSWKEGVIIYLCALSQATTLICLILLVAGAYSQRWQAASVWTVAGLLASLFLWDNLSYRWLGLHIEETIPLLYWSMMTTFRAVQRKQFAVVSGIVLLTGLSIGTLMFLAMTHGSRLYRRVSTRPFVLVMGFSLLALALCEASIPKILTASTRERRRRILPLLPLYVAERPSLMTYPGTFVREMTPLDKSDQAVRGIHSVKGRKLPDIYLFVIESLRSDHLVPEVAPHLSQFATTAFGTSQGIAASNCTHVSWYSVFHSRSPMFWSLISHQPDHPYQSIPLAALSQVGYQIRVLATPNMDYYAIGNTLFGPDRSLASEISDQRVHLSRGLTRISELDRRVMDLALESLDKKGLPTVHLVFLDSTHHDYEWSDSFNPPFKPFLPLTSLLKVELSADAVPLMKNRYKNALAYVDSLMGEFLAKSQKSGKSPIIAVTGDHGEEHFEKGHVTHASDLNQYQLRVPVLLSLPGKTPTAPVAPVSHLDIFPTLLDAIGVYAELKGVLDGQSLLDPKPGRAAISAQCSNYTPYLYLVDAGDHKAIVEFRSITNLKTSIIGKRPAIIHHLNGRYEKAEPQLPFSPELSEGLARLVPGWDTQPPTRVAQ